MNDSHIDNEDFQDMEKFLDFMITTSNRFLNKFRQTFDMDMPDTDNEFEIPSWFPNPQVYGPLIDKYRQSLDYLMQTKDRLNAAIDQLQREMKKPDEDDGIDQQIRMLHKKKEELVSQKNHLLFARQNQNEKNNVQAAEIFSKEERLKGLKHNIEQKKYELEGHKQALQELMSKLQEISNEQVLMAQKVKKSNAQIRNLEEFLHRCREDTQNFMNERNLHYQQNVESTQKMKALSVECTELKHKIDQLKEQLQDHNQMLAAFDLAKKQLEREKGIEATVIEKMKEAVNSAESFKEEAERLKRESLSLREEVNRAKQQLSDTLINLKAGAKKKIEAINANYQDKILEADKQFTQLLNDNAQLTATIETMRRQLSFLESQNSILRSDDGRNKTGYEEFCRGATSQLELLQSQLEELTRESQKLKDEEQRQRNKLNAAEADSEKALSAARKNVDKLESDLAQVKASLSEAEAQGSAHLAENNRLNSELARVSIDSKRDVELRIAERENEIRILTSKLDEMRRTHVSQTAELQRVLLNTKRHADKWKTEAENVAIQSEQGLEETEEKTQLYAQKIASLTAEIERQEGEAVALQQLVAKRQQEARDLQSQYEVMERRVFDQKTQLDALYEQQIQFATQREDLANRIDQKRIELKRLNREQSIRSKIQDETKKKY